MPQFDFGSFPMDSSLINVETKWWKTDLVRSIFLPFEAESILKIPISYSLPKDQLIWMGNNRAIHNDSAIPPAKVWDTANRAFLDFNVARLTSPTSLPPSCDHWTTPPSGFFKVNVNGATENGGGNSCIEVVIKDSSGFPISALSSVLPSCFSAEITEAYALLHGVLFALELQIDQVIFESDALSIILSISSEFAGSDFSHILEDIKAASSTFSHCSFHHLKRDGNRAAHTLAKEAKSSCQSKIWKGFSPPCILNILREDLM
nr:hypothetical protein CFP56_63887 [Quercus suber]